MWNKCAGACCPHHEIPQPRVRVWVQQKEETNATSINHVLDEIFRSRNDSWQYANYKTEIVEKRNCQENGAAKAQQKFVEKRSERIDQNLIQRHALLTFLLFSYMLLLSCFIANDGKES